MRLLETGHWRRRRWRRPRFSAARSVSLSDASGRSELARRPVNLLRPAADGPRNRDVYALTIDFIGHRVIAYHRRRPLAAVEMLAKALSTDQLRALKIRSGEHVAAIVATMVHFEPPVAVDIDGGPDLQFGPSEQWERPGVTIAYEVKSIAGGFREFLARSDDPGAAEEFEVTVRAIDEIVREVSSVVRAADDKLATKVSSGTSRNVLLVLHPFDEFPIELADEIAELLPGAALSTAFDDTGLDTVTIVVIPPGSVAQWSRTLGDWQSIVFASNEDDEPWEEPPVMKAEREFMARVQPALESPYDVWVTATADESG